MPTIRSFSAITRLEHIAETPAALCDAELAAGDMGLRIMKHEPQHGRPGDERDSVDGCWHVDDVRTVASHVHNERERERAHEDRDPGVHPMGQSVC